MISMVADYQRGSLEVLAIGLLAALVLVLAIPMLQDISSTPDPMLPIEAE
ncbi:MAG: hypothetical protein KDD69_08680 [Bdellovibrionales bacterium]|nr:hypothetical protein [Bdellovibrionales bacterium]